MPSALCRCCHAEGDFKIFKSLQLPYSYENTDEVYGNMLQDTFGIIISLPTAEASASICDACIVELRAATRFKKKVEDCERKFLKCLDNEHQNSVTNIKIEIEEANDYETGTSYMICPDYVNDAIEETMKTDEKTENHKKNPKCHEKPKLNDLPEYNIKTEVQISEIKKELMEFKAEIPECNIEIPECNIEIPECNVEITECNDIKNFEITENSEYLCKICNMEYANKATLTRHIAQQHTEDSSIHRCPVCLRKCKSLKAMQKHFSSCTRQVRSKCHICGRNVVNIEKHKLVHSIRPYVCDHCKKTFPNEHLLKRHVKSHLETYSCDLCKKVFVREIGLREHNNKYHNKKD